MAIRITENRMLVNTYKTYKVQFFTEDIYTTVTANPAVVTNWIDDIKYLHSLPGLIVGLDVEWRPSYSAQRNLVATLQHCVRDRCLVYQIIHSNQIPESLSTFLSRKFNFITFVGVDIKADLEKLQSDYGIDGGAFCVDLRGLVAEEYGREEFDGALVKAKNLLMVVEFAASDSENSNKIYRSEERADVGGGVVADLQIGREGGVDGGGRSEMAESSDGEEPAGGGGVSRQREQQPDLQIGGEGEHRRSSRSGSSDRREGRRRRRQTVLVVADVDR